MIFNLLFTKIMKNLKEKNTMNESVYLTLYVLSSRKQQGASFLVGTKLQQWKNKKERNKMGFPLLSFFFELLEFFEF